MSRMKKMFELFEQLEHQYEEVMTMTEFEDFVYCFPGLLALYGEDGDGIAFSKHFCTTLQYSESELQGKTWQELIHPDDVGETTDLLPEFKNGAIRRYKNRWRRADGQYLVLRWAMAPWTAAGKHNHFTICVAHVEGVDDE